MGCRTGFYLLLAGDYESEDIISLLREMFEFVCHFEGEISGGQQQRVAIARALIVKPRIVFADEPTGNLDTRTGEDTMKLLTECAAEFGQTLIVVTHNPEIAKKAQQIIRIEDGCIIKGL